MPSDRVPFGAHGRQICQCNYIIIHPPGGDFLRHYGGGLAQFHPKIHAYAIKNTTYSQNMPLKS